MIVVADTSPIN
jgi:predicted nucleic acid-binding protein